MPRKTKTDGDTTRYVYEVQVGGKPTRVRIEKHTDTYHGQTGQDKWQMHKMTKRDENNMNVVD